MIDEAEDRLNEIKTGTYDYPYYTDDVFLVRMADGARLSQINMAIDHSTAKPEKLLKDDGTIDATRIVESVRVLNLTPDVTQQFGSDLFLTLKSFLTVRSIRGESSCDIDWSSSNNSTPCAVQHISVPILVMAMGGTLFYSG